MRIDIHLHWEGEEVKETLRQILTKLDTITQKETQIMAAIDDLEAAVAQEETVIAGVVTLLQTLKTELDAAIAAGDTARLQALSAKIGTDTDNLAAAVAANTPAAPPTA